MDNAKLKHLEFIQNVISRMGHNSFLIKGWCITIISAFIAVTVKENGPILLLISIIPVISFWLLDGYYLQLERKYRILYDLACKEEFPLFQMKPINEFKKVRYLTVLFSKSIILLYLPLIIVILVLYFLFK